MQTNELQRSRNATRHQDCDETLRQRSDNVEQTIESDDSVRRNQGTDGDNTAQRDVDHGNEQPSGVRENTAIRDRSRDLIPGIDLQVGEVVRIQNLHSGQPSGGLIVVITRDGLYKIKGVATDRAGNNRNVIVRRIDRNIVLLYPRLH